MSGRAPVSVIVLTFNEERNLSACLESVSPWVEAVFIVDSGSTDRTLSIASAHAATVAAHAFDTHARQWQWALAHLPLTTEWVLALDADQRVTPALRDEIVRVVHHDPTTAGVFVPRRQVFRGKWIRFGGYYPKYLLKLFRRGCVSVDDADLVDHHFAVRGTVRRLQGDLIEDNRNELAIEMWTAKHNRYAVLQARQQLQPRGEKVGWRALFGAPDRRTQLLKQIWNGLPLFVRPCLYVTYRYVLRLGFLDGKQGFIFHVLHAFWYRLLVDINIDEMRGTHAGVAAEVSHGVGRLPAHESDAESGAR